VVGAVEALGRSDKRSPLLFFKGEYHMLELSTR